MEKTSVFNLIILDASGSMSGVTAETISGCNETIATARRSQEEHADAQRSFLSIFTFDSDMEHSRYIVKNAPIEKVRDITSRDYRPGGMTPLLDAVGTTLSEALDVAATHRDALGIVTIITDGYENSSHTYDYARVARLIDKAKELGWIVNLIGAEIDVVAEAGKLHIDNHMSYTRDSKGTVDCFACFNDCIVSESQKRYAEERNLSIDERKKRRRNAGKDFFKH